MMEFDFSTFALEIINFLILVWLLARYLYRPIREVISKRQREIQKQLDAAAGARGEAESLKTRFEARMAEWDLEKSAARKLLQEEIARERRRLLDALQRELDQEREKARVLHQRRVEDEQRGFERMAWRASAAFCAKLLSRLAAPELEALLIDAAVQDLETITATKREQLRKEYSKNKDAVSVTSVYPIADAKKHEIERRLAGIFETKPEPVYRQEPELIAGLRIRVGGWQMQANLQEELRFFADDGMGDG